MIKLLDCTLRDGAHVNGGKFGHEHILRIADELTKSSLDYVELGFLKNVKYDPNISFYPVVEKAYDIMPENLMSGNTEYALMARADQYDFHDLSECNGKIKLIRIAFYQDALEKAVEFANEMKARGYKFTFNLINTPGSSKETLMNVVDRANALLPEILTIVDTFGVLQFEELSGILNFYDKNLNDKTAIGLHVHENLSLAFSLAQYFLSNVSKNRNVVIDGSLMGMGRIPGNLCIELIADYLNEHYGSNYQISNMMGLINDIIMPIKRDIPWGYASAYFLSAKYRVHRSYAEYLLGKGIPLPEIDKLFGQIDAVHALKFNKDLIESLLENI